MNKRIKELADKAGIYLPPDNPEVAWKEVEHLCELVIKECGQFMDPVTRNLMMKHFGIKNGR